MEKLSRKEKLQEVKFDADGLVPAIVQDERTRAVLMMAYMNRDSLEKTMQTGKTWFWSRSRQKYWQKGESSGHVQEVKEIYYDCDGDTLLIMVEQVGVACHTGHYTCFFNPIYREGEGDEGSKEKEANPVDFISVLGEVIRERKAGQPEGSYVAGLIKEGEESVARKVGEEALETVLALMASSRERLVNEGADLLFHLMVALESREVPMEEVLLELRGRHGARK